MRRSLRVAVVVVAILAGGAARAEDVKLPQTAAEHLAMSKSYQEKAASWRSEATYHREMAREYTRSHPDRKSGARNPWAVEMEKHCAALVKDAERLASDADELARFHRLRAMELEGK